MAGINLLNKRRKPANAMVGKVWFIAKNLDETKYYVKDASKQSGAIRWTQVRSKSMQFHTEAGAHHFIHAYMQDRRDIYLINAPQEI